MATGPRRVRRSRLPTPSPQSLMSAGQADARSLIARRSRSLARRNHDIGAAARAGGMRLMTRDAGGAVLLAEGDSWFDYPFSDVLGELHDLFRYRVESAAHKGDTIEGMAYDVDQLAPLLRKLDDLRSDGRPPKAVLISGGGNDIAGPELATLLNHRGAGGPALSETLVRGVIDERLRAALIRLIGAVTELVRSRFGEPPRILLHGYDYPVPDGRGYAGGFWILPGPWLEPSFRAKGHVNLAANTRVMRTLIDRFNAMVQGVAGLRSLPHVRYVDLRGVLVTRPSAYRKWWANELHPTVRGFQAIAGRFHEAIQSP